MARKQAENGASAIVDGGQISKNAALTQSAVGITSTALSTGFQIKASNAKNDAIKVHGNKSNELKREATKLENQTVPSKIAKTDTSLASDTKILKNTSDNLAFNAAAHDLQLQLRMNDANNQASIGMATGQVGNNSAGLVTANSHVAKAEAEAKASLSSTDQAIYQAAKEADERRAQFSMQFRALLMEMWSQVAQNNSNTISAMASNIKG